jgi:hypothetical protein
MGHLRARKDNEQHTFLFILVEGVRPFCAVRNNGAELCYWVRRSSSTLHFARIKVLLYIYFLGDIYPVRTSDV